MSPRPRLRGHWKGLGGAKKTPGQHNIAQDEAYAIRAELEATAEEKELGLGKLTLGDIGASPTHAGQGAELKKKLRKAENPIDLLMTAVIGLVLQWLYEGHEAHPGFPVDPPMPKHPNTSIASATSGRAGTISLESARIRRNLWRIFCKMCLRIGCSSF